MPFTYVYLLVSQSNPNRHYTGLTRNLNTRLQAHNAGKVSSTAKYRPWKITVATAFRDPEKAVAFEKYLKSNSGRAFARKRL